MNHGIHVCKYVGHKELGVLPTTVWQGRKEGEVAREGKVGEDRKDGWGRRMGEERRCFMDTCAAQAPLASG